MSYWMFVSKGSRLGQEQEEGKRLKPEEEGKRRKPEEEGKRCKPEEEGKRW